MEKYAEMTVQISIPARQNKKKNRSILIELDVLSATNIRKLRKTRVAISPSKVARAIRGIASDASM
ncbi:hypothetical protein FQZ97_1111220 [compost metagenome]